MIRNLLSPPFLRSLRWGTASVVNSENFQVFLHLVATSPLPPELRSALRPDLITNWGQFGESASLALVLGILQLIWACITHPVTTLTIAWWFYESVTLLKEARDFIRQQLRRWRRGVDAEKAEGPGPTPEPEPVKTELLSPTKSTLRSIPRGGAPKSRRRRAPAVDKASNGADQ